MTRNGLIWMIVLGLLAMPALGTTEDDYVPVSYDCDGSDTTFVSEPSQS